MYCVRCGAVLQAWAELLSGLRQAIREMVPLMPVQGRLAGHMRLLAHSVVRRLGLPA